MVFTQGHSLAYHHFSGRCHILAQVSNVKLKPTWPILVSIKNARDIQIEIKHVTDWKETRTKDNTFDVTA